MMDLKEYAIDVDKTPEEIMALCDKIGIKYDDENSLLSDGDITILDNELQDQEDYIEGDIEEYQEKSLEEETIDIAEELASLTNFDLDNSNNFQKVKSKVAKRADTNKKEFFKERKNMYKNKEKLQSNEQTKSDDTILYKEGMSVGELAQNLNVAATELVKKLMLLGVMAGINQAVDYETAEVIAAEYNKVLKKEETADISNFENFEIEDDENSLVERPPVVTIMGHVDHGKTTLLDTIRKTDVVSGEAGGITQAVAAYSVKCNGKKITFIDTPGHAAFTEMRARGASITDVVIIIVAADDGVMPQTREAIAHAKEANVPIIVAINKIDKPEANIEKVLAGIADCGLTPEDWGGDTVVNKISAKSGDGINELLENILLVSEMEQYKANPSRYATGTVIESKRDHKVGTTATVLIQNGTLRLGDPIVVGTSFGKVRTLKNDKGQNITEATPSMPVEISGISEVPEAGDKFMAFETEKQARQIAGERLTRSKEIDSNFSGMTLDDLFGKIQDGDMKEIKIVLKADVNGSLEAVKNSLQKIEVEGVKVNVIHSGVGAITESDVILASASSALVIGFNVRGSQKVVDQSKQYGVELRTYNIIYKVVEDIESAMKGMLDPEYEEKVLGTLSIRAIFKFSKVGLIAGCHVTSGTIKNKQKARIIRDDIVVYDGSIKTLQQEKDQVKEVRKEMDCGITLENCQDYKENDIVEVYELVEIKR